MELFIISVILLVTLCLLVSERIPTALTAIGIIISLVIFRILTPKEAVLGFAHPAVITVGAMFVMSKGMVRTGAVEFIGRHVIRLSRGNATLALLIVLLTVAVSSAFINNTPIVVLFIPIVMAMCCEYGLSPSTLLIPISYASILAGTCTLIGTSTNIIISDLSAAHGFGALTMFELATIGFPLAVVGLIFLMVASPRLMPSSLNPICQLKDSDNRSYMAELAVPRKSNLIGKDPSSVFSAKYPGLEVLELIRYSHIFHPTRDEVSIAADDLILVKGSLNDLVSVLDNEDVTLPRSEKGLSFGIGKEEPIVVELLIPPQSALVGQRLLETNLMGDPEINVIAIKRSNLHFTEKQIHDVRLRIGDIILIWCNRHKLDVIRAERECIIIEDVAEDIVHKRKAWFALSIFLGMIVSATLGLADIMTCALTASFLLIITGCLQMRDVYKSLQGDLLLLIVGTISLGAAMQKTGASWIYAEGFLRLFEGCSPQLILGGIIFLTSISTQILSNNATAVLLFPIAVSVAKGLGIDPKPFIIGVCFGASACFATPMGYQTNLLVFGPGGYRFTDYMKMGIPLNLLVLLAGTLFIPYFWPF